MILLSAESADRSCNASPAVVTSPGVRAGDASALKIQQNDSVFAAVSAHAACLEGRLGEERVFPVMSPAVKESR
jgi:hypothetical protein